jgi:hypothetical protein
MNTSTTTSSIPAAATAGRPTSGCATRALIVGVVGLAVGLFGLYHGFSTGDSRPVFGWLIGWAFWYSMFIGVLFLVILTYLFDTGWAVVIRRQLEHMLGVFPVLLVCFVPLLLMALGVFGHDSQGLLWKWLNPDQVLPGGKVVGQDPDFLHKAGYLSLPFFLVRLAIYFFIFWAFARGFRRNSFALDRDPDPKYYLRCRKLAAGGIYAVAYASTFGAFDLFMSLSYQWFSTIYGVWFFSTSVVSGLAATIVVGHVLSANPGRPLYGLYNRAHRYTLACMLLAFVTFWAFISFSQYLLTYMSDMPEEAFWYNMRELTANWATSSWWWVSMGLVFGYFFLPFFALLPYESKVRRGRLLGIAIWILFFQLLDLYFNILPNKLPDPTNVLGYRIVEFMPSLWDAATLIGVGGLCAWAFMRSQAREEIIPLHDPRIEESLKYHE